MRFFVKIHSLFNAIFRRRHAEQDLAAELAYHLEQEIQQNIHSGMSLQDARFAALRSTGSVSLYQEECRDQRGIGFLETTARDIRFALRTFRRAPLFVATAILTLALGIGANTTVFTFVDNILLRPIPAANPSELMFLNWGTSTNISFPNYLDFRDRNTSFSSLFAYRYMPVNLGTAARNSARVWGYEATGNYFDTLGIKPLMGRFFSPSDDDKPGAHPVLVISHRLWQQRFAADPAIIGRNVKVNGFPFTIVGVAMPQFSGTELIVAADYWVPLSMVAQVEPGNSQWPLNRLSQNAWVMGRLKPGVSRRRAEADLDGIVQQLARTYPSDVTSKTHIALSRPGLVGEGMRGPITSFGVILTAVAGAGLLLACVNLAGLLLARASSRRREVGIRLALGAGKWQIVRQLLTESLLLAASGGLLGTASCYAACRLINAAPVQFDIPFSASLQPNALVLAFTAAVTVLTTLLFGLLPALQTVRPGVLSSLKNEPALGRFRRLNIRDFIVAGQVALSVALVVCSVLMVRSLQHALTLNIGFQPAGRYSVAVDLKTQGYTETRTRRFQADLLGNVSSLPGVQSAGIISNLPLNLGGSNSDYISRTDQPLPKPADRRVAMTYSLSPGYLKTAGTRLLAGRDFDLRDNEHTPGVALVNQALANLLFPHDNPLGHHVRITTDASDPGLKVVGVVETGKYSSLGEDPVPAIFMPLAQAQGTWTTLLIRTALPPAQAIGLLRKSVLDLDPELTLFNLGSLNDHMALPLLPAKAAAIVLGIFGGLAIVLAATGLFASLAYSVARRRREIGIRIALGARPHQVLNAILRRTFTLCLAGILLGTLATLALGGVLSSILYGVSPRDPLTYAVALTVFLAVALLACWHPASRAIAIHPAQTLRED